MTDFTNSEGLDSALSGDPLDLEIAENEDGLAELLDGGNASGEMKRASQTGDLAVARGDVTNPEVVAKASAEWDHTNALALESERMYKELEGEVAQGTVNAVRQMPHESTRLVADMTAGIAAIEDLRSGPAATELAVIQRAAEVPLATAARENAAFNIAARNELITMLDEQSLMDRILDVGGMFVPARTTLEWEDVKSGVKSDKQLSAFLTGDSIAQMITSFQGLPLERKKAIYPALAEMVFNATGIEGTDFGPIKGENFTDSNMVLGATMLMRFLDPEGGERASHDQKVDLGLEALSFAPAVGKMLKNVNFAAFKGAGKASPFRPTPKGPTTASGLDAISNEVAALPPATRKAMESVLLSAGEVAVKEKNLIKVMAKAGDKKGAARMNIAAMSDDEVARAIGITPDEAVQNAMPFQTSDWLPQITDGLIPEMGAALNNFYRTASKQVTDVTSESIRTRIGATHIADRANQVKSFEAELNRVGEDVLLDGYTMENVKITGEDTEAFTYEFTLTDNLGDGRTLTGRKSWLAGRVEGDYAVTAEAIMGVELTSTYVLSPAAWARTSADGIDFADTVKLAVQMEDLKTAIGNDVATLWVEANKSVAGLTGKGQRVQLNALDIEGDEFVNPTTQETGKIFLPEELQAKGVTDPDVVEAYYKRRLVADAMHAVQNYGVRREYELLGYNRSIAVGDAQLFVKPFDDIGQAKSSLASKEGYNIYDPATGKTFAATTAHIDTVYDSGRMIVRSHDDWNTTGNDLDRSGEYVEYIAVQRADVRPLPEQVIHYKAGYVPKANEGIEFVVQRNFPKRKVGAPGTSNQEAMRAFASKIDAETFRRKAVLDHANKTGKLPEDVDHLYVMSDGSVMTQIERATNSLSGSSGLFRGTRAKDELLMGLEGKPLERVQPEDIMGRWLDHISTGVTKNEARIGKEQEWMNTVRRVLPEVKLQGFEGTVLPKDDAGNALERLRNQLKKWNSTQSRGETLYEASAQKAHDWVMNGNARSDGASKSILWLKHKDVTSSLKTANMHTLLGALNPAQIYVQASGASIALSLQPVAAIPGIIQRAAAFTLLDNVRDAGAFGKMVNLMGGESGFKTVTEATEAFKGWERSGLRESVRGNADLQVNSATGLGMAGDFLRKAENVSLYLYRLGELMNRRVSYVAAHSEWRTANPNRVFDDAAESEVLTIANKSMLELNSANAAPWQGGGGTNSAQNVAGVATQFMQVLAKTGEVIAKGEGRGGFTPRQKGRLALGQIAFFGAAGVPLISMIGPAMVDYAAETFGAEPSTPEGQEQRAMLANTYNQGAVGFITRELLGADVEVASRSSLGLGVFTAIEDIAFSEDPSWARLLGVSTETIGRAATAASDITSVLGAESHMFQALASTVPLMGGTQADTRELTMDKVLTVAADIGMILATIPSTGRNALKGRIMNTQNVIMSRRGAARIRKDFDFPTELAVALGFQPSAESRLREVETRNFSNKEHMQDAVTAMLRMYHRYVYMHNRSPEYGDTVILAKQVLEESFNNPQLRQDFNRAIESRILRSNETAEDRALLQYFKTTLVDEVSAGYIMDQENALNPGKIFSASPVVLPFSDPQSAPKAEE